MSVTPSARSAATPALPSYPSQFWRLLSEPMSPSSVWSTLYSCARCLFPTRRNWCGSLHRPPPVGCPARPTRRTLTNEFRAQSRTYQDVTGYEAFTTPDNLRLSGRGEPQPATGIEVIGNFFQVLGVQPVMGRLFTPDEARGTSPVALLTNAYWRRQFNADPGIVGKAIDLNGIPMTWSGDRCGRVAGKLRLRRGVFCRGQG